MFIIYSKIVVQSYAPTTSTSSNLHTEV